MNLVEAKQRVADDIQAHQEDLWGIATKLFENPEIAFEEFKSSALLKNFLAQAGFEIEAETGGLETAFQAAIKGKADSPKIAFLAEFDALPEYWACLRTQPYRCSCNWCW